MLATWAWAGSWESELSSQCLATNVSRLQVGFGWLSCCGLAGQVVQTRLVTTLLLLLPRHTGHGWDYAAYDEDRVRTIGVCIIIAISRGVVSGSGRAAMQQRAANPT